MDAEHPRLGAAHSLERESFECAAQIAEGGTLRVSRQIAGQADRAFSQDLGAGGSRSERRPQRPTPVHVQVMKTLRKAHAAWQAERGAPERVLQDRLGHSKGSTVTRAYYVQITDEACKAAVMSLPVGAAPDTSEREESTA